MTSRVLSPQRRRRLSSYLVLAVALMVLGSVYAAFAPAGNAQTASTEELLQRGQELFELNCSSCHGVDARGTTQAPSLEGVGTAGVDFQVGTGRMPMATVGQQAYRKPVKFTQEDIDALAAYVVSIAGEGPEVPTAAMLDPEGADVALGGRIYAENCAQCHSIAGSGGALIGGVFAPDLTETEPHHIYEAMETSPGNMPSFLRQLNEDEKRAVVAYLLEIRGQWNTGGHPIGRIGPVSEGVFGWVLGIGACLVLSVWIGSRI